MSMRRSRRKDPQACGFVKSSALRGIAGNLSINRSLPSHGYVQQLVKDSRESSTPECMPREVFSPDETLCVYASASYHLPDAYVESFPCPHCTYKDDEERTSFVEVFHFPNVHNPGVCATVKFIMPANINRLDEPTECSVEVEFANGCPNAPLAEDHSPSVVLHIATDVFIEVLRFLPRSELEKMMLQSRHWSNVIGGGAGSLQQRRCFFMDVKVAINISKLRIILSSWQAVKLHVFISSGIKPRDSLLTLPTRIIRDFLALRDVNRFVAEFSLHFDETDVVAFSKMPDVDEAIDRRKRFRYHLQGEDTVVRVSVYKNPTAHGYLTVVTFDHFRRSVLFFTGNMSVTELKQVLQRPYDLY